MNARPKKGDKVSVFRPTWGQTDEGVVVDVPQTAWGSYFIQFADGSQQDYEWDEESRSLRPGKFPKR